MFEAKTDNKYLIIQLAIISLCIVGGLLVKPLLFIPFAISVYTIVKNEDRYAFCQLFFILPFTMIYKLTPSSSSFFSYTIIFYALYILVFKHVRLNNFILISVYLLFGLLSNLEIWLKFLSGFILLTYFIENNKHRDIIYYVLCFAWGLILSSIVGLYKQDWPILLQYFDDLNEELMGDEIIARFSALYNDPNYYSISIIIAVYFLVVFFVHGYLNKFFALIPIGVLVYFGFLTYSKMYLLSILLVFVTQMKGYIQTSKSILYGVVAVPLISIFILWKFFTSEFFVRFLTRIDTDNISSNRFMIWEHYIDYLSNNITTLIFGVGFSGGFYNGVAPHNSYIEGLYFLGIIGSVIYIISLLSIVNSKSLIKKKTRGNYLIVIIFMIVIGTLGVLTLNDIWLYYMLIWAAINWDIQNNTLIK